MKEMTIKEITIELWILLNKNRKETVNSVLEKGWKTVEKQGFKSVCQWEESFILTQDRGIRNNNIQRKI